MSDFSFCTIGTVRCSGQYKFEAPRQGIFASAQAVIELKPEYAGEALNDLAGFERLWVLFVFHCNMDKGWKAQVAPPYTPEARKYGLYATRAPYRPNPIGMSCVKLERIESNRRIFISEHDILDGTPVLDIKPYIPQADAFPNASAGWRDELVLAQWELEFSGLFIRQANFLLTGGAPDMFNFCHLQLQHSPLDRSRRRISEIAPGVYELGCRTWRIKFRLFEEHRKIAIDSIRSNYTAVELAPGAEDKYGDKELHRRFCREVFSAIPEV